MEAKEAKIKAEIDHIITCIHKNASEELNNNIHSFARKVFSSVLGRPNNDSLQDLRQKITTKVAATYDQRSAIQCQDALQKFSSNGTIFRKPEVLRMLMKLSEINNANEENLSTMFRQAKKKDFNITLQTNLTNLSESIPNPPPSRKSGQLEDQLRIVRNRGSLQEGISESDLIKQLSLVFTNTTAPQILQANEGYQLKTSLNVTQPVRKMVSEIADLGWLHKRISRSSERDGTIKKALRLAIHEQLKEFYIWNSTMQGLIKSKQLSLRKLYILSFYPQEILRWLAIILEAVEPFDGSHIISIVNSYRPSGLSAVDGLINRLLSYILQPLLNYIHNWIYLGELHDVKNQFFILQNKKVYESEEWTERFKLVSENIPNILNSQSAKMIFNAGKSIYFLKNKCKIFYNVKTPFIKTENIETINFEGSNSLISSTFINWLTTVHNQINKVLVETLLNHFHLKYHLQSIKNFFLCCKGDFIQHLYDNLQEILSMNKQQITEQKLDRHISDAIQKCFVDFKLPKGDENFISGIANRLLAKKLEFGNGVEGWDCFNFQYSLQGIQPLQAIFTPEAIINYQKIFNFLWKLKKVKEILKSLWISLSREQSFKIWRTKSKELHGIFHFIYGVRSAMNHFVTSLHSYLMVTIEQRWNIFWEKIDATQTFDEILKRHKEFQLEILEITLNTPKEKNIQAVLGHIFAIINNFKVVHSRLQENFDDYYEKLRLYEDRQIMAQRGIVIDTLEIPQFNIGKSFKDARQVKSCFDSAFQSLYTQLRKESDSKISNLNVLCTKLDFSQYYSNKYME